MEIFVLGWVIAVIIGFPALMGLWTARLWEGRLKADAEVATPAGIVIGISLVSAASAAAAFVPQVEAYTGPYIKLVGLFALAMFGVGVLVGFVENRSVNTKNK
jgi:hypothetical protein